MGAEEAEASSGPCTDTGSDRAGTREVAERVRAEAPRKSERRMTDGTRWPIQTTRMGSAGRDSRSFIPLGKV